MAKVFVLAGTTEGRTVAERLSAMGYAVTVSTLTAYGAHLVPTGCAVRWGPLDEGSLAGILDAGVDLLVDATHPYAREITGLARSLAAARKIPYLRLSRPLTEVPEGVRLFRRRDIGEACRTAFDHGRRVFSAIGSRWLHVLVEEARRCGGEVVARVLPDPESLQVCFDVGLAPDRIVAMQGPFSRELNRELLLHYRCDVLLTKDSGQNGGTPAKLEAAVEIGLPVVLWDRSVERGPGIYERMEELLAAATRLMEGKQ